MRQVVKIEATLELQKLGNVPDMLRRLADRYQSMLDAGTHREIKDTGLTVTLNDGDDVSTAKSRCVVTVIEQDAPDLAVK